MKIITPILSLLAITSTYSLSINKNLIRRSENNKYIKRSVNVNVNRNALNISLECRNDISKSSEYKECSDIKFTKADYDYLCSNLNSQKCQNFYKDPLSYIPNCKNDQEIVDLLSKPMMETNKASISFMCTKDSEGNICPAAEASLNGKNIDAEAINETCKSKECIKGLSEMLKATVKNIDAIELLSISTGKAGTTKKIFSALLTSLESEQCVSQSEDVDTSSDSLNLGPIFMIALILLISFFLLGLFYKLIIE